MSVPLRTSVSLQTAPVKLKFQQDRVDCDSQSETETDPAPFQLADTRPSTTMSAAQEADRPTTVQQLATLAIHKKLVLSSTKRGEGTILCLRKVLKDRLQAIANQVSVLA